jgi:hypothetical protein
MVFRALRILALVLLAATAHAQESASDVRVLIDTSGSMKKTDPRNLRIPSLKLLLNLLPAGSRVGVWLFDAAPELLVAPEPVDAEGKTKILQVADKIHSRGLFTHIEAALDAAVQDWYGAAPDGLNRCVILLTDGMVDVSKDANESAASRQRVLTELLPKIQTTGAKIHTIGLSDQSDQALLRQLSVATGGWAEIAHNAQELQRGFVRIFNKAVPQNTLPLKDNRFTVDASIEEFTVLVLLPPNAKPTQLVAPDGGKITRKAPPKNTHWVHEDGYDLITVSRPATGDWKLVADADPDNQVLIVTHLTMEVTQIPNFLVRSEIPEIAASFSENGQPIDREDFLKLLTVSAALADAAAKQDLPMPRDPDHPVRFTLHLEQALQPGSYTLTVNADGRTFQRQAIQTFTFMDDLVKVETAEDHNSDPAHLTVTLTPNPGALLPDSLAVHATLTDQANQSRELEPERHEGAWHFGLPLPGPEDHWIVNFSAAGKTPDGQDIAIPLKPLNIDGKTLAAQPPEPAAHGSEPEHEHPESRAPTLPFRLEPNWPVTAAATLAINLVVAVLWFLAYRAMKKRHEAIIANLLSKLSPALPETSP